MPGSCWRGSASRRKRSGWPEGNRERQHRTLTKLVSQPIFRCAVVNGKFPADVVTVSIALVSLMLPSSKTPCLTKPSVSSGSSVRSI